MNMMNSKFSRNPMAQMMNGKMPIPKAPLQANPQMPPAQSNSQPAPINPTQFQKYAPNLNDNILQQLANQARAQGISEQDITNGINFIHSIR